jgi:hypothetical protein
VIEPYKGHLGIHISLIVSILIMMIMIHEWSHLMTFMFFKVPIKAIFVLGLGIIFKPKFKIIYDVKLLKLFGGIVIPLSFPVSHIEAYQKLKKGYQSSLLIAPLITLISPIIFFIISLLFKMDAAMGFYIIGISIYFTWVIFPTFFIQHQQIYGDFKAYHQIKSGGILFEMQLISQAMIHGNVEEDWMFIFNQLTHKWNDLESKQKKHEMILSLIFKGIYQKYILDQILIQDVQSILHKKSLIHMEPYIVLDILYVSHQIKDEKLWFKCMQSLGYKNAQYELDLYHAWLSNDLLKIKHLKKKNQEDLLYFNYVKNEDTMLFWSYPNVVFKPMVCEL